MIRHICCLGQARAADLERSVFMVGEANLNGNKNSGSGGRPIKNPLGVTVGGIIGGIIGGLTGNKIGSEVDRNKERKD